MMTIAIITLMYFMGILFFDTVKDPKWSNMGHEMIAFTHYYIVENGESFYLHAGESVPMRIMRYLEFIIITKKPAMIRRIGTV